MNALEAKQQTDKKIELAKMSYAHKAHNQCIQAIKASIDNLDYEIQLTVQVPEHVIGYVSEKIESQFTDWEYKVSVTKFHGDFYGLQISLEWH